MNVKKKSSRGNVPDAEGTTHINIHPKSLTALGRLLSFYRNIPFVHPNYGPFCSIEGFSHYLRTGCKHDSLRYVSGFQAKEMGRKFPAVDSISRTEFNMEILYANYMKIRQNMHVLQMVVDSTLPFDSYYRFGPNQIIVDTRESGWFVDGLEEIRHALKEGTEPKCIQGLIAKYDEKQKA